jgi:hypothetical protein
MTELKKKTDCSGREEDPVEGGQNKEKEYHDQAEDDGINQQGYAFSRYIPVGKHVAEHLIEKGCNREIGKFRIEEYLFHYHRIGRQDQAAI